MYQTWTYFFGPLSTDIHEDILFESLDFQGFVRPIVCWHVAYRMYICPKVLGVSWCIYGGSLSILVGWLHRRLVPPAFLQSWSRLLRPSMSIFCLAMSVLDTFPFLLPTFQVFQIKLLDHIRLSVHCKLSIYYPFGGKPHLWKPHIPTYPNIANVGICFPKRLATIAVTCAKKAGALVNKLSGGPLALTSEKARLGSSWRVATATDWMFP